MKAIIRYADTMNNIYNIEIGTHLLESGGMAGGYCYNHQSFDCILTEEEQKAVDEA